MIYVVIMAFNLNDVRCPQTLKMGQYHSSYLRWFLSYG